VVTALGNSPGAIGHALATFQIFLDLRMMLQALHFFERAQVRVAGAEVGDQTDINLTAFQMIQERAAGAAGLAQRPASSANYPTGLMVGRIDLPQFLDPHTVTLGRLTFV